MKLSLLLISAFLFSCGTSQSKKEIPTTDSTQTSVQTMILPKDTIITVGKTPVWIQSPEGVIKADILVLPGWNFPKEKICNESDFCKKALAKGYRLILPEMMKSIYASQYYPETRNDYKSYLTLTWVTDTMIPALQKEYGIFNSEKNYLHGISTGSRGAALVHLKTGKLFSKVVLLSGDYDQTKMQDDNLMKNVYGPYSQFKQRWTEVDNPTFLSANWTADLYIAHGKNDDVVPVKQSIDFSVMLSARFPDKKMISHFPEAKHDFEFWGGETEEILKFFDN